MSTKEVSDILLNYYRHTANHKLTIPNYYYKNIFEMDIITITNSKKTWEIEIKNSLSDYKKDFEKAWKHAMLEDGKYPVDRFYYASTPDILSVDMIPKYAGLIHVHGYDNIKVIKQAPIVSGPEPMFEYFYKDIGRKCYYRMIALERDKDNMKNDIAILEHRLRDLTKQ